ncbi:hypothetical protein C808_02557 [Lachnospiraceae bacterium M18-1]|nr:hypothetical protein C808_02557 [Lachnospiraceae bacterium M18-1]
MKHICNPININYRYQFTKDTFSGETKIAREAADPSMICFKGKYYIFASMTLGVWESDDLTVWVNHRLPKNLPLYDYAPDVRVIGEYVYFCASNNEKICNYYRTKDVVNGPYEEIRGTFDFWDPNMFCDEDGKIYFYWGCSSMMPVWGVELDPETMLPIGEKRILIEGDASFKGYERIGEDHSVAPASEEEIEAGYQLFLKSKGINPDEIPPEKIFMIKGIFSKRPYVEGAWMTRHEGKYYLQYACPGAEYNTYADGVYVSDAPLGPFSLAENNPYSYKPGGFLPGAGHGSTMEDREGNLWHTSTMRISMNYSFERRVGIWPAGFDQDGELFCNQRYGDWPFVVEKRKQDPWRNPDWYLLSYRKPTRASSSCKGKGAELAVDENVQTWWRAAHADSSEWIEVDLKEICDVHAIQINFADDKIEIPVPGEIRGISQMRYIEEQDYFTRWVLEGSLDGKQYFIIEDKSDAQTDLSHDLVVREDGVKVRYLRLTVIEIPYHQNVCISGLRVFGIGNGQKPVAPEFTADRINDLDMEVKLEDTGAVGYNILWGHTPDKLYHSYMVFSTKKRVGALVKGQQYYVRVDAFNENGITEGTKIVRV